MKRETLRYTAENPPADVMEEIPNWVNAYGEEELVEQDESTIMPESQQTSISEETSFTAGKIEFANGVSFEVLITLNQQEVYGFCIYKLPEWPYISFNPSLQKWTVLPNYDSEVRAAPVMWWSQQVFPARVQSVLPLASTGFRWETTIHDGNRAQQALARDVRNARA